MLLLLVLPHTVRALRAYAAICCSALMHGDSVSQPSLDSAAHLASTKIKCVESSLVSVHT